MVVVDKDAEMLGTEGFRPLRRSTSSARSDKDSGGGFLTREAAFARYRALGEDPKDALLPISFRVNTLKVDPSVLIPRLLEIGVSARKIPFLRDGYQVERARFSIGASVEYLMGYLYIQEAAAQLPVQALDPQPGETVADLAAAPGGKTTQLAEWMENRGVIVALEKNQRISAVRNNLERLGVSNVAVFKKDARFLTDLGVQFDKILVDAPCSGNFVGDRYWFGKRSLGGVHDRSVLQKELLKAAFDCLKPGGSLVYSTCSLEPEEDELVVDFILRKIPGIRLADIESPGDPGLTKVFDKSLDPSIRKCRRLWPWKTSTQGFFMAKFIKADSASRAGSASAADVFCAAKGVSAKNGTSSIRGGDLR